MTTFFESLDAEVGRINMAPEHEARRHSFGNKFPYQLLRLSGSARRR